MKQQFHCEIHNNGDLRFLTYILNKINRTIKPNNSALSLITPEIERTWRILYQSQSPFFPCTHHLYEKKKIRTLNRRYYKNNHHIQNIVTLFYVKSWDSPKQRYIFSISCFLCSLNLSSIFCSFPFVNLINLNFHGIKWLNVEICC